MFVASGDVTSGEHSSRCLYVATNSSIALFLSFVDLLLALPCLALQIVIATPGRLCELVFDRRRMKLGMVRTVVLDEVDALLRPPYDQEIDAIMDATPGGDGFCACCRSCRRRHRYVLQHNASG